MEEPFRTISTPTTGLFKDRGSKFISFAFSISDAEAVKPILNSIAAEHPSARHVCYAYILGPNGGEYRANDDGEPNGSAGLPILNQIRSKEITNTLVAVVRYFGGTKLGVSGLVSAYKEAAKDALSKANVIEKIPTSLVRIRFQHSKTGDIERLIGQHKWNVQNQEFGIDCLWTFEVPTSERLNVQEILSLFGEVL